VGSQLGVALRRGGIHDPLEQGFEHTGVIPDGGDADGGCPMMILVVDLGHRNLKATPQAFNQATDDATLFFEAGCIVDEEFEAKDTDMHDSGSQDLGRKPARARAETFRGSP
jgi:hypothetical protein